MPNTAPIGPDAEPNQADGAIADADSTSEKPLGDWEEQGQSQEVETTSPTPGPVLARFWRQLQERWQVFLTDQVTPVRLASHLALLMVAILVLVLSQVDLPRWEVVRVQPAQAEDVASPTVSDFRQQAVGGSPLQETGVLLRAPVPFTEIPDRPRLEVITYTVQIEDTVLGIAEQFGLNPNTIVWANLDDLSKPFVMAVGQVLLIPPVDGVLHTVEEGDSIEGIAEAYDASAPEIAAYESNQLASADQPLTPGQVIVVPGGSRAPPEPPTPRGPSAPWRAQDFVWPAFGRLTQGFWLPAHPALDIGAPRGATVRAADWGTVTGAGWSAVGYGNYIIVSHGDGYVTLYAHLDRIDVSYGEQVARGQQIGTVGSTGRSTGPHLHFEVSFSGRTYNPLLYLP
jgi:LysM repeat protein